MKIETARKAKELIDKLIILEHSFNWFKGSFQELCDIRHLVDIIIDEIENLKDE